MYRPGKTSLDGIPTSQQDGAPQPPSLYNVCRDQCPICDEEKPSFRHVAHHLRRIAAFALPRSAILEDDIAPGSQDSNDANLESDEDSTERLSESGLEDIEGVSSKSPLTTSPPQDPIPGRHHQPRSGKHPYQPSNTSNLLSSIALKQLDHSSQMGLSIRDYLSVLDYDGSEQDAGQWREMTPPQASVSESLAPSRPDGYEPSQPPNSRIVESQFQDMMKKSKVKQEEPTLAQNPSVRSKTIPTRLSFCVRIQPICPDYGHQPIRHGVGGEWMPPDRPYGLTNGRGPTLFLRWKGGRNITVSVDDPIHDIDLDRYTYRAATLFTQYPDTPHLLAVPFDARTRSVRHFGRGWQRISFNHNPVGNSNSNAYYSYISDRGAEPRIAAPGPHWIPQLLSAWYDCHAGHATRKQAGLIGELPLLYALAAFSVPPESLELLLSSMQPGRWDFHGLTTGRK